MPTSVVDVNYEGETQLITSVRHIPGYKCPLKIQPSGNGTLDEKKERDWLLEEKENRRRRRSSDSPDYAPTRLLHIEKSTRLFSSFFSSRSYLHRKFLHCNFLHCCLYQNQVGIIVYLLNKLSFVCTRSVKVTSYRKKYATI